ncbi:hypothetical protein EXIGLDRAFT_167584 [Exidia glandulosa HHB12029]|uniref:Uncharacterized protein n=1 Tax=Exidia glandulosa HHB12029 TaxID=1314781 RepID=A0A165N606_EXIGL|nr:hypothetical protein EXIGLDRAFT_167584 [Exidia glandulosa HHB12029]
MSSDEDDVKVEQANVRRLRDQVKALHLKFWTRPWPDIDLDCTISNAEIGHPVVQPVDSIGAESDDESVPLVDDDFAYGTPPAETKLETLVYSCFKNLESFTTILGLDPLSRVLVVRKEYIDLYEALTNGILSSNRTVIVTGQPGIGKSEFLIYLLLRRLRDGLPTAIQFRHSHYLIFDEKGGAVRFTGSDLPDPRLEKCWALADSNDKVETPCVAFRGGVEKLVQAASPDPSRWKRWVKYHLGYRVVMALPTALEIGAIVRLPRLRRPRLCAQVGTLGPRRPRSLSYARQRQHA